MPGLKWDKQAGGQAGRQSVCMVTSLSACPSVCLLDQSLIHISAHLPTLASHNGRCPYYQKYIMRCLADLSRYNLKFDIPKYLHHHIIIIN